MMESKVLELVRVQLAKHQPGGASLSAVGARKDGNWWHVIVKPSVEPVRRYEYYEALADVESVLQEEYGITVLLVPVGVEPQAVAA